MRDPTFQDNVKTAATFTKDTAVAVATFINKAYDTVQDPGFQGQVKTVAVKAKEYAAQVYKIIT